MAPPDHLALGAPHKPCGCGRHLLFFDGMATCTTCIMESFNSPSSMTGGVFDNTTAASSVVAFFKSTLSLKDGFAGAAVADLKSTSWAAKLITAPALARRCAAAAKAPNVPACTEGVPAHGRGSRRTGGTQVAHH